MSFLYALQPSNMPTVAAPTPAPSFVGTGVAAAMSDFQTTSSLLRTVEQFPLLMAGPV